MKLKLLLLSSILCVLCITGFAQTFEKNKETGEYYSQKPGEEYYMLEDWNEDSHLLPRKFNTMDDGTAEMEFAQQWIDKHYLIMTYNEDEWGTGAIRKFGIDNTKNSTVSLDVEILKSDEKYNSFCGLIFGRGVGSSYYEKYVFAVGKTAGDEEFRYKIMHVVEEDNTIKFNKLTEGEISEWEGGENSVNNLTVKCEGNTFSFLINKNLVTTLAINKTEIDTKYSGLWLRGKNLKVAFDNLEITGVNKYPNVIIKLPDSNVKQDIIKTTPPTTTSALLEKFDDNSRKWGIVLKTSELKTSIEMKDGKYVITANNGITSSLIAADYDKSIFFQIGIETFSPVNDKNPKNAFGLAFGAKDNDNYYSFLLSTSVTNEHPDKEYIIGKVVNGKFKAIVRRTLDNNLCGSNTGYKIKVEFSDNKWNFIVNESTIWTIAENEEIVLSDFGPGVGILQSGYNYAVAYDNLQILTWKK